MSETVVTSTEETPQEKTEISFKTLLEAGSHFGSRTSSWHPKASPFIYGSKKDIYIIDLEKTIRLWEKRVRPTLVEASKEGKVVLFVSTKDQGRQVFTESAIKSGSPYVNERWRAGLLTNFDVVRKSVLTMEKHEARLAEYDSGNKRHMTKQEANLLRKEVEKLRRDCDGVRHLKKLPDFVFVVDASKDTLAVQEAKKLDIPVIALVDTNVDPTSVDFPLPANDDAVKTIVLFSKAVAGAIIEGKNLRAAEGAKVDLPEQELTTETTEAAAEVAAKAEEDRLISEKLKDESRIQVEVVKKKKGKKNENN